MSADAAEFRLISAHLTSSGLGWRAASLVAAWIGCLLAPLLLSRLAAAAPTSRRRILYLSLSPSSTTTGSLVSLSVSEGLSLILAFNRLGSFGVYAFHQVYSAADGK